MSELPKKLQPIQGHMEDDQELAEVTAMVEGMLTELAALKRDLTATIEIIDDVLSEADEDCDAPAHQ